MEKAGNLLKAFLDRLNIRDKHGYSAFFASWRRIVGDKLADHTDVVDVRNGALVVICDHPGWMQEFQFRQHTILTRVQTEFPQLGINAIQFKLVDERVNAHRFRAEEGAQEQPAEKGRGETGAYSFSRAESCGTSMHGDGPEPVDNERYQPSGSNAGEGSRERPASGSRDPEEALSRMPDSRLKELLGKLHERLEQDGPQERKGRS